MMLQKSHFEAQKDRAHSYPWFQNRSMNIAKTEADIHIDILTSLI